MRQSVEIARGHIGFKAPKNGELRTLSVGKDTVAALEAHRKLQHAQIFEPRRLGLPYDTKLNLIFVREDGTIWHPDSFAFHVRKVMKTAQIWHARLHNLRHSCASLLIASGESLKVVSDRLGHSSIGITADTYGHVYAAQQDGAAAAIDALLTTPPTLRTAT